MRETTSTPFFRTPTLLPSLSFSSLVSFLPLSLTFPPLPSLPPPSSLSLSLLLPCVPVCASELACGREGVRSEPETACREEAGGSEEAASQLVASHWDLRQDCLSVSEELIRGRDVKGVGGGLGRVGCATRLPGQVRRDVGRPTLGRWKRDRSEETERQEGGVPGRAPSREYRYRTGV